MLLTDLSNLTSLPFTSSLEPEVEQVIRPQDQVPNLPSEPLPEMESKSEELRMLPQSQPIPPEEDAVEKEEDCDLNNLFKLYFFTTFFFVLFVFKDIFCLNQHFQLFDKMQNYSVCFLKKIC